MLIKDLPQASTATWQPVFTKQSSFDGDSDGDPQLGNHKLTGISAFV